MQDEVAARHRATSFPIDLLVDGRYIGGYAQILHLHSQGRLAEIAAPDRPPQPRRPPLLTARRAPPSSHSPTSAQRSQPALPSLADWHHVLSAGASALSPIPRSAELYRAKWPHHRPVYGTAGQADDGRWLASTESPARCVPARLRPLADTRSPSA